ncbi:MAG: hypothetical protein RLZZ15_4111 [Verrucomicrobiota bacterium]|jgi:hypothetical protein
MPRPLTLRLLQSEAAQFAKWQSARPVPALFGTTDGKAVGTHVEHEFQSRLQRKFSYDRGNSAKGIDFPALDVDLKVTSIRQPQSSCPFRSARQKIYGLGYSLIVFVYDKRDDAKARAARLEIQHTVFVDKTRTADFQTTTGLRRLIENHANRDDILAFFEERLLPVADAEAIVLADEVLAHPPLVGCLTISNALQWRLQYSRAIEQAGSVDGVVRLTLP